MKSALLILSSRIAETFDLAQFQFEDPYSGARIEDHGCAFSQAFAGLF